MFFKELADLFRFIFQTSEKEKKIVFYAEHEGYYSYLEGIIDELIGRHGKSLCYVTSDPQDPILHRSMPGIKPFYLNKLLPYFMQVVSCRVFVMTLTDLNQFQLRRSVNPVHYVYAFHSLVSTHMIYRHGSFDHYDSILCCGKHHFEEIRSHEELNRLPAKHLIKSGYYRLERIYAAYQNYLCQKHSAENKVVVLIAPSWGADNILESCGERIVKLLIGAGYKVIVRPHPETIKRSPGLIDLLNSKFSNNQDFTLEKSVATDDSLLRADILISDYSGITLEYAFGTERPFVLFLDVPPKVQNNKYNELGMEPVELAVRSKIGVIVSMEKLETIPTTISYLMANKVNYKRDISELRKKYVFSFGDSSGISAQYITSLMIGDDQECPSDN